MLLLEPRPETNAIPQGQKTTMTLLTEAPVPDLYTLEVVTSRLAEPRTMTETDIQNARVEALGHERCDCIFRRQKHRR
jgi:hypothetical protein